jgi:iron complex transport system ATP-binding protein
MRALRWAPGGRTVLDGIDLKVEPGEVLGLLGPNGSGKSSLLRCVYRRHRPDSGAVLLDGTDVWSQPARYVAGQVAVVTQDMPADLEHTVAELVSLGRIPHQRALAGTTAADDDVIAEAMTRCGVTGLARRTVATLSGGERQRVQLARALAQRPRLLVLDEPTNHLDLRHQVEALELVGSLGVTVLVALHDLDLAAAACDRLVVLDAGRVAAAGPPAAVITDTLLSTVYRVRARVHHDPDGLPRVALRMRRRYRPGLLREERATEG